ncbi:MAG: universal stress protein [Nitrospirota bacterium]|nr:universal stress protein [Nitrospirota bacterium]
MTDLMDDASMRVAHIFHPTDFSPASMAAFGYALKLSLGMRSDLTIMHVDPTRADPDFEDFPRVRATLSRWGILREGATKEDLLALGLGVRKIRAMAETPVTSILQLLWRRLADLMVLATHPNDRLAQWLSDPIGESLARKSRTMSLFVPDQSRGLVSLDTGTVGLQRILIPVDHRPLAQAAVDAACMMTAALGVQVASFELLYVGAKANMPSLRLPRREGWTWNQSVTEGVVVDEIFEVATWLQPDLIVMATEWRHGFLDALRGSTTERVLRRAACPLLAVPVG